MLWMLFADERLSDRILEWKKQAPLIIASFRRDYARMNNTQSVTDLLTCLESRSPMFKKHWNHHEAQGKCQGIRTFQINDIGMVPFDHKTIIVDEEKQLRLVYYAAQPGDDATDRFHAILVK